MKIVPDWKEARRWLSVQISVLGGAVVAGWAVLPEDIKDKVPDDWSPYIVCTMFVAVVVGRLVDQK